MQEEPTASASPDKMVDKVLSTSVIWRLAQIVLVLAASYLYFYAGSFGGILQQNRLLITPHTDLLIKAALTGLGVGLCIGLALKNFSSGQVVFSVDWPTLIINLIAAFVFVGASITADIAGLTDTPLLSGGIKNAIIVSPLLAFVWVGLTLTTLVQPKPVQKS